MKALTIREPYASLIANGYKFIETRSWKTAYRGPVLIHAALKEWPKWKDDPNVNWYDGDIHHGEFVAIADIVDCVPVEDIGPNVIEENFGFYDDGRYAWILDNIIRIKPVKRKGGLRLWEC